MIKYVLVGIIHLLSFGYIVNSQKPQYVGATREYCMESFNPRCGSYEVVIMQNAMYGRMQIGRCVKQDYGVLGCSLDVLDNLDRLCSGKQNCELVIPNPQLTQMLSCIGELNPYLEAGYNCQPVYNPKKNKCVVPETVSVTKISQYLGSGISLQSNCGQHATPWVLQAKPGQQITTTLIDFHWQNTDDDPERCSINYGYILDTETDDVINICGGGNREKHLFTSFGHNLQIVLDSSNVQKYNFLIRYEASGCPRYSPPKYSWVKEDGVNLIIGCDFSDNTWKLQCVNNMWLGIDENCTHPPVTITVDTGKSLDRDTEKARYFETPANASSVSHNHVVAFALGCVTLVACCIVVFVGIYCIRKSEFNMWKNAPEYSLPPTLTRNRSQSLNHVMQYRTVPSVEPITPYACNTFPFRKDNKLPNPPPQRQQSMISNNTMTLRNGENHIYMSPQHDNLASEVCDENNQGVVFYHVLETPINPLEASAGTSSSGACNNNSNMNHSLSEKLYQSMNFDTSANTARP